MKRIFFLTTMLVISSFAFAQNTISGTLYANDVKGFIIIGCLLDLATSDCDYEKSQLTEVNVDGTYRLTDLEIGEYLVIAWRDTNSSGNLEEDLDEIAYFTDANGQAAIVSPPATDITLTLNATANPLTNNVPNPLDNTGAGDSSTLLIGTWAIGLGGDYDPTRDDWGFGDSFSTDGGHRYTFNADGTYQAISGFNMVSFVTCIQKILFVQTGTYVFQNDVLYLTPSVSRTKSDDNCDDDPARNYVRENTSKEEYKLVRFNADGLELTSLIMNSQGTLDVNPEDSTPLLLRKEM